MEIIKNIIFCIVLSIIYMYMWSNLFNKKYNIKDKKVYLSFILLVIIIFNLKYINLNINVLISIILFTFVIKLLFNERISVCLFVSVISEMISLFLFILLDITIKNYLFEITFIYMLFIVSELFGLYKINRFIRFLIIKTKNINILLIISSFIILVDIFKYLYFTYNKVELLIICDFILIIYLLIIYKYILFKNKYTKISDKYSNILEGYKNYEEIMDKYRVLNHENKNQLLTIRAMLLNKEESISEYIDTIINTRIKDNEKLMFETNVIPSGGLKAIIYSKMLCMQDNNINIELDVERSLRRVNLNNMDKYLLVDICKIVGVFLDNAIEEVKKLDKKEIRIKLYIENNNLCIMISNKYLNIIDIDKIYEKGYTTKEKGHGYGLALVKNIIEENSDKLINDRYIDKSYFVQNLKIVNIKEY